MQSAPRNARFWDKIARKYAAHQIKDMAGYERTVARARDFLTPDAEVLEIGCGTGSTALALAPSVRRILATDISGEMVAIAQEKARAHGCVNVTFAVAAHDHLPGTEGAYDAVLAFNVLHLLTDRPEMLAQIHARLKPGGLFISKTPCLSEMNPLIRYAVPVAQMVGKAPFVAFFAGPMLEADIEGAGFTILARERHGSERKDARAFIAAKKATA